MVDVETCDESIKDALQLMICVDLQTQKLDLFLIETTQKSLIFAL